MKLKLIILNGSYTLSRFANVSDVPDIIKDSDFYSITKTKDEVSVVSKQVDRIDNAEKINTGWKIIKVSGPLDFSLTGIIAGISGILNENKIPILTISTYDTDYFMVKSGDLKKTVQSLKSAGHDIIFER